MREKKTVPVTTLIVVLLATVATVIVSGCAGVFGLSDYSFDETLGDGGSEASTVDAPSTPPDGQAADSSVDSGPAAPTCTDRIANGKETDVDCGGPDCPKCAGKKQCALASDCADKLACVDGLCLSPSSNDMVQDGSETDVDCGGTSAPSCADGLKCVAADDCKSKVCDATKHTCTPPSSTDGIQNGSETDKDCGGTGNPTCSDTKKCVNGTDCTSRVCTNQVCKAPTATDGYKNGSETDVDCGGSAAPKCVVGLSCGIGGDCASSVCMASKCIASAPNDGVKNGSETDVDCGGGAAPACGDGLVCIASTDCTSRVCGGGRCLTATGMDGVKNGSETDIDCGGGAPTNAKRCADTKACGNGDDCVNKICTGGSCKVPTSTDNVKNGAETDTDCGGGSYNGGMAAPACAGGKACVLGPDCKSTICSMLVCTTATSSDGAQNGGETDVDCGGGPAGSTNAPLCADNKGCGSSARDCLSGVCNMVTFKCMFVGADGAKNGNETDVDCGGPDPTTGRCEAGLACVLPSDCVNNSCTTSVCD